MRIVLFALLLAATLYGQGFGFDPISTCVRCHADQALLTRLGAPQMYLDPAQVDLEVGMNGAPNCVDCHLGDNRTMVAADAHKGMPRPFFAAVGENFKFEAVDRAVSGFAPITPQGENRSILLQQKPVPELARERGLQSLGPLFFHDHDPQTLAFDPTIARQTCGKCHSAQMDGYAESGMGLLRYQRAYTHWTASPPGPHNCGVWFGDNYERIAEETTVPFAVEMNAAQARSCNSCHPGCNDCHYQGFAESKARHRFTGDVSALSCYGGGRGATCHSGPMERRRGAGFLREEFAVPLDELSQDVHARNGLQCVHCHQSREHDFGHQASVSARDACHRCHPDIVAALGAGTHRDVDCSACHVQRAGGYQFSFWGPGHAQGQENVYAKHNAYSGVRSLPTLVRHPESHRWIPLKPYPMATLNVAPETAPQTLSLRTIPETRIAGRTRLGEPETFTVQRGPGQVNDMYALRGTVQIEGGGQMLAWVQFEKLSHALGPGRDCASCHANHHQRAVSWYTFADGSTVHDPFHGAYSVLASEKGLTFSGFAQTSVNPAGGRKVTDFAPFIAAGAETWNFEGVDLSLPFNEEKVDQARMRFNLLYARLHELLHARSDVPADLVELRRIRSVLYHNADVAEEMLEDFFR